MLKIFRPAAVAVTKTIILGCRSQVTALRLASLPVKFGLGQSLLELEGWSASAAVAAWNSSENVLISSISAAAYTASGWYEAIRLTSNSTGDDFRVSFLIDDEEELLLNETHVISVTGRAGTLSFSLPSTSVSVEDIDLSDAANGIEEAISEQINASEGIEAGDVTVSVSATSSSVSITLEYAGQFANQSLTLPEIDSTSVLRAAGAATLLKTRTGSVGVNHVIELGFTTLPEYETSSETQSLTPSTAPAPSTGTFDITIPEVDALAELGPITVPYNASAAALEELINDAYGDVIVSVTKSSGIWTIEFVGDYAELNIPLVTVDDSGLAVSGTPPVVTVTEVRKGVAPGSGVNEVQVYTMTSGCTGGSFQVAYPGEDATADIAHNASAATIQSSLEAVLGSGNVTCTGGPINTTPVVVTFGGSLAATNIALPTITDSLEDGKSVETDLISSGAASSAMHVLPFIGTGTYTPVTNPVFTCNITQFTGVGVPALAAGDTFTFTWRNPYAHDGSTLTITCTYGMTIRQFWAAVRAKEATVFDDSDRTGIFLGPSVDLDTLGLIAAYPTRCYGEGLISRNSTESPGFLIREYALRYQDQIGGGSAWVPSFSFSRITNGSGVEVGDITSNAGTPTITSYRAYLTGTFKLSMLYQGDTYESGTLSVSSVTSLAAIQSEIDSLLSDAGLNEGDVKAIAYGTGSLTRNESQFLVYEMAEDLAGTSFVPKLSISPVAMSWNGSPLVISPSWSHFTFVSLLRGGRSAASSIQQIFYSPNGTGATGSITWGLTGSSATTSTASNPSNAALLSAFNFLLGVSSGITLTGGPLASAPVEVTFEPSLGPIPLLTATYTPSLSVVPTTTTNGLAPGVGTAEQQSIVITNVNGGTLTISDGTHTTASIPWNAGAGLVQSACTAASLPISAVALTTGGWLLTFSTTADESELEVDDSELRNTISPQPSITPAQEVLGGVRSVTGGLTGGTFDLSLTRNSESFSVLGIPYDVSNDSLKSRIEAVIGVTVTVTGGALPDEPVTLTFEDDVGLTHWVVEVIPHVTISEESGGTVTVLRDAELSLPQNVWDLEIVPGTDTPGLVDAGIGSPDDWGYIVLKVVTPDGTLSEDTEPSSPGTGLPMTRLPSLIKINWVDLTAHQLERIVNEAFGEDCCRVTQPIQSIEHEDFDVVIPVASGSGQQTVRIKCWYNRSVFRLSFFGSFADPDSLELSVQVPIRNGQPISVREFMSVTPASDPDGETSIRNDVMGTDSDDAALESARIASAFYMAELGGEPLHRFTINRSSSDGLLRFRFKLLDHYMISSDDPERRCYGVAKIKDCNIQFHWARASFSEDQQQSFTVYASTPLLPYNASPTQIRDALTSIVPGFLGSGNVLVEGSLYGSWESDAYDPAFGIPADAPSTSGFNGLQVTLIGDQAYLPYNTYGLSLIMSIENRDVVGSIPLQMFFYRSTSAAGISRQDMASMPMIHFESLADVPLPSVSKRVRVSPTGTGPYVVSVAGEEFELLSSSTAASLQAAIATRIGPSLSPETSLPLLSWSNTSSSWVTTPTPTTRTWLPASYAVPVRVFGTTLASGPFELEFTAGGLQFEDVAVGVGATEYDPPPIYITVIEQGEFSQHTEWQLTLPTDASSGLIEILDTDFDWPIDITGFVELISTEVATCSSETTGLVTTITFDDDEDHTVEVLTSNLTKAGSASAAKTVAGGLDGTLVTYELVQGAGPLWFNSKANWTGSQVPNHGDEIVFNDASGDVKYGLDMVGSFRVCGPSRFVFTDRVPRFKQNQQVLVQHEGEDVNDAYYIRNPSGDGTFALSEDIDGELTDFNSLDVGLISLRCSVEINARYDGQFGLAEYRASLPEYLPKYLALNYISLVVGTGEGDGLALGRFDAGSFATSITINKSQDGDEDPAIRLLCSSADTMIVGVNASVGIGGHLGESSLFNSFVGTNVVLLLGRNTTYTSINNNDGTTTSLKPALVMT